ncbi:hypothetical protein KIPB_005416, partial [Kipferlia bialata]|eukprot:g5416.t1
MGVTPSVTEPEADGEGEREGEAGGDMEVYSKIVRQLARGGASYCRGQAVPVNLKRTDTIEDAISSVVRALGDSGRPYIPQTTPLVHRLRRVSKEKAQVYGEVEGVCAGVTPGTVLLTPPGITLDTLATDMDKGKRKSYSSYNVYGRSSIPQGTTLDIYMEFGVGEAEREAEREGEREGESDACPDYAPMQEKGTVPVVFERYIPSDHGLHFDKLPEPLWLDESMPYQAIQQMLAQRFGIEDPTTIAILESSDGLHSVSLVSPLKEGLNGVKYSTSSAAKKSFASQGPEEATVADLHIHPWQLFYVDSVDREVSFGAPAIDVDEASALAARVKELANI